jgi:selenide,water dikinase
MIALVKKIKLTALSSCAGCAAKLGQNFLGDLLRELPRVRDSRLLVGMDTADDAGVFQISPSLALVQTVDFFTPIVDDPFLFGSIAATNALSDVFAMGGRPITGLNILGMPDELVPPSVIVEILRGGAMKAREAKCALVGGHSIKNKEPIYGLAVTGLVSPRRLITNAGARDGDWLVLTKPLGTGIITTALKRGLASPALVKKAARVMTTLNSAGAEIAEAGLARGGTDITGFGVLGHLTSMCRASAVGARIFAKELPVIDRGVWKLIEKDCVPGGTRANLENARPFVQWNGVDERTRVLLADAQTSGGLLLCVSPKKLSRVMECLKARRTLAAAVVGRIEASRQPRIQVSTRAEND